MHDIKYKGKGFEVFGLSNLELYCSWLSKLFVVLQICVHLSKYLAMEAASSKTDKVSEAWRGRKKKIGGMKFSGSKALQRNALRKRDASGSCEEDRIVDEGDKNDEDEP